MDGTTPTRMWVVEVNGRSIGFVQDYRIGDYPDFALLAPDPDAVGLDYAIGEPGWVGRQLGARVLWAWAVRARQRFPDVTAYFAAPDHRNRPPCASSPRPASSRGRGSTSHSATGRPRR